MTLPIVSPTLFNGHGLAAAISEHHAQPGCHVRVNTHPLLGLPVAPFIIWRGVMPHSGWITSLALKKTDSSTP